ncbi:MAG: UDP-N-acetylmuramoyl-L-alanine--D-glutamate ligase [Gammaproteobacteria bacterium]
MNNLNQKQTYSSYLNNANILVVGVGKTGASVIKYLLEKSLSFRVLDSRENPPDIDQFRNRSFDLILGGLFEEHFVWADTIILSPGISQNEQVIRNARTNGKTIIGDIELFMNEVNTPVVAITGSNGKSTVTSMVDSIGSYSDSKIVVGGNIGIPALALLETAADLYVLELSSFQLEIVDAMNFVTSVILNLSEDHMDRYETFDDYCVAKLSLLKGSGNIILNFDDKVIRQYSAMYKDKKNIYWFTLNKPTENQYGIADFDGSRWICVNKSGELIKLLNCAELNVVGDHNITNAMVALMISQLSGIDNLGIQKGLINFKGLAHRTELIKTSHGVKWINDSKATNIGATSAAINGLKNKSIILIMGGQSKGQDFSVLNSEIKSNVKLIILFGEDANVIDNALDKMITRTVEENIEQAVAHAKSHSKSGDIVLFSPACASFDMFENFEHRGDVFINIVKDLII